MFTKNKKLKQENLFLRNRLNNLKSNHKECKYYENYLNSIGNILKEKEYNLYSLYMYNKKLFAIFIQQKSFAYNNTYYFYTYELPAFPFTKVCVSDIEIHKSVNEIYVFNIDTEEKYQRQGHASKHIKIFKKYMEFADVSSINGEILPDSSIGYENLKHFYEKNGFKVNGYDFSYKNN